MAIPHITLVIIILIITNVNLFFSFKRRKYKLIFMYFHQTIFDTTSFSVKFLLRSRKKRLIITVIKKGVPLWTAKNTSLRKISASIHAKQHFFPLMVKRSAPAESITRQILLRATVPPNHPLHGGTPFA